MDKNSTGGSAYAPRTPMQIGLEMAESAWQTTDDDCGGGEYGTDKFKCLGNLADNITDTLNELGCGIHSPENDAAWARITELVVAHADPDFVARWTH